MKKDFDNWNENKKIIDEIGENKFYHPRDVWWCNLGVNVGFEQDGTGKGYVRPIVVMKGFSKNVCFVVPLTTSTKQNPYHIDIGMVDGKRAFAIYSQLRLIDTKRFVKKVDVVNEVMFIEIKKAIRNLFQ
jgi:mRNA interferase MazF